MNDIESHSNVGGPERTGASVLEFQGGISRTDVVVHHLRAVEGVRALALEVRPRRVRPRLVVLDLAGSRDVVDAVLREYQGDGIVSSRSIGEEIPLEAA